MPPSTFPVSVSGFRKKNEVLLNLSVFFCVFLIYNSPIANNFRSEKMGLTKEVFEEMCKARMAVTKMRAAMRDAEMTDEKSKKINRLVRDMIELIARFEGDFEKHD